MSCILKASKECVLKQINDGKAQLAASGAGSEAFALIIDGKSLAYALEDDVKNLFLELAIGCASVICCRSSPKQKALVSICYLPCLVDLEAKELLLRTLQKSFLNVCEIIYNRSQG